LNQFLEAAGFVDTTQLALLLGVFLATALFFLTIYLGLDRKQAYLLFFSYTLFEALSLVFLGTGRPLPFLAASTLVNLSLLYFFATFFDVARSKIVAGIAALLILVAGADVEFAVANPKTIFFVIAWFAYALTLMACSWIALRAATSHKYAGRLLSITTAAIFILSVVLVSESFFVSSTSISSVLLILAVTYTVLHDVREQQALVKALRIRAVQLENEMLKKSIQPHFLLNTLTVLSEWIEEQPELAVKQIDLLSQEFRFITRVSDKVTIPIAEELKICQVHLDVFNAKQSKRFTLETKNIAAETRIPPMIFHTLVENGLTHSNEEEGRFVIEQQESGKETSFRISSEPLIVPTEQGEGLGLKYVESRLEQAFPGKWSLKYGPEKGSWVTVIVIPK
jgi:hypothetical protein